ncbi:hypothetical protein JCGZ_10168 [Jatropha curcas]|uniref:DUF7950 domain-containing protein n=1 Tax=Jatropha curcas TaxID=180498 RepID=A0A067LG87_JATCU|nr:uncharacterized protein LOC105633076 [Jatropha curcas]KDP46328.1 hypothetical protein JCGZ_10168 [Jatropha curcas]
MDGGERWRMIRCAGGVHDKMIINQIMLRFRPIAPKPASGGPDSGVPSLNNKSSLVSKRKTRRKYVRVRKNNRFIKRNQKVCPSSSDHQEKEKQTDVVTLQLLPERSNQPTDPLDLERSWCNPDNKLFKQSENNQPLKLKYPVIDQNPTTVMTVPEKRVVIAESWVTVECVTDINQACMDGGGLLGCTDVERVKNLEEDTRPGFISDGSNNVRWVNGAYKKMMSVMKEKNDRQEIVVWLVRKEKLVPYMYKSAFTCWVRLSNDKEEKDRCSSKMVPCDVWRMDCGGFAWRLDVEAALSLGL